MHVGGDAVLGLCSLLAYLTGSAVGHVQKNNQDVADSKTGHGSDSPAGFLSSDQCGCMYGPSGTPGVPGVPGLHGSRGTDGNPGDKGNAGETGIAGQTGRGLYVKLRISLCKRLDLKYQYVKSQCSATVSVADIYIFFIFFLFSFFNLT